MSKYIFEEEIIEKDPSKITYLYDSGFILTRKGVGVMQKIRSLRIDLRKFELSSENRRILRKNESLNLEILKLPLKDNYDWRIHAMGYRFYKEKFGDNVMSANRIKSIVKEEDSSFNSILKFSNKDNILGYTICFILDGIIHYAYPFYDTSYISKSLGIGMMTKSIEYFKNKGFNFFYLGSVYSKESVYKLQFKGCEWFDKDNLSGSFWNEDLNILKKMLS